LVDYLILLDAGREVGVFGGVIRVSQVADKKNAGLEAATLISAFNPVSQVLW
jgi:hypothetical protein